MSNNTTDQIWDWLGESNYDELTGEQKQIVDQEMGREEYMSMRSVVSDVRESWEESGRVAPGLDLKKEKAPVKMIGMKTLAAACVGALIIGLIAGTSLPKSDYVSEDTKAYSKSLDSSVYPDSMILNY